MKKRNHNSVVAIDGSRLELHETKAINLRRVKENDNEHLDDVNISDLLRALSNHKLLIIAVTSLVLAFAYLYTISVVPTYRAKATIKIDREPDQIVSYDVYEKKALDQNFSETQIDILRSRKLASRVIEQLGLEEHFNQESLKKSLLAEKVDELKTFIASDVLGYANEDASVNVGMDSQLVGATGSKGLLAEDSPQSLGNFPVELKFLDNLTVAPSKKSNIVSIYYESTDPDLAAKIVNTLGENYIEMNLESRGDSSVYAEAFLNKQLKIAKGRLQKSEEDLVAYAKENNIVNTDDDQSIVSSELQALSRAYTDAQTRLIAAESEYRQKNKVSGAIRLLDNSVIQNLKKKKSDLAAQYTELLQVYKPAYPRMREIKGQISALDKQIAKEVSLINRGASKELETNFLAAKQNAEKLSKQLADKKTEMMALRDKSIGYQTIKREVETNRELYDGLLQRIKEVGVASGAVTNNVSFLDPAFVPFAKYRPNGALNLAIGLLFGLMAGVGLALLRDHLDERIKSADDIEELVELPIIGYFPFTKTKRKQPPLMIHSRPFSPLSEAFRSIVVDLEYSTEEGMPKIIHITSSAPAEGKTCSSINMASVMALEGKRVVLIDCDLRKPSVHKYLGMSNEMGVTDVLTGKVKLNEALQATKLKNLAMLPAGALSVNPVQLLASRQMIRLLDHLADQFDQVVIDSPPVLGMADSLVLANRAHATVFAVANEQSKKTALADSLKRLNRSYGNVIGVLMTKVKHGKGSYYSYENYYSYGEMNTVSTGTEVLDKAAAS